MLTRPLSYSENAALSLRREEARRDREPIVEACGKWFYYGPWWSEIFGPFNSRKEAHEAHQAFLS